MRRINTVKSTGKEDHVGAVFIPNPEDSSDSDYNDIIVFHPQ